MATLTTAYASQKDPWKLATVVASTVVVLWLAHVYAHTLGEHVSGHQRRFTGLGAVARRELGIVLAGVPPCTALVLGAIGVLDESRAVWAALGIGLGTLAAEGIRYARLERLNLGGTLVATGLNLALGLIVVALKVIVAH